MTFSFSEYSDPEEAFLDENLAKFGDALVNLIYSLARSMAKGEPDGAKVSNKVLSDALSSARLRISKFLDKEDFQSRKKTKKMSEKGFKNLLLTISKRIPIE